MPDISFEEFDTLVNAWINGERPNLEDLYFDGWNVEAMVRFMLDVPPESEYGGVVPPEIENNVINTSDSDVPF